MVDSTMSGAGGDDRRCSSRRYRGVRRRRWGKWVSEIRVPGTRERLWLGSYASPEAAAVAHDTAACLLRGGGRLNFPERAALYAARRHPKLSPRSVQRVASDAGMAADAQLLDLVVEAREPPPPPPLTAQQGVARVGIIGVAARGGEEGGAREKWTYAPTTWCPSTAAAAATTSWCTVPRAEEYGSRGPGAGTTGDHEHQLVYGDISVDDMEIYY